MTSGISGGRLLTANEVAEFTGLGRGTLYRKRKDGTGPRFIRLGQGAQAPIRYRLNDVEAWIDECSAVALSDLEATTS